MLNVKRKKKFFITYSKDVPQDFDPSEGYDDIYEAKVDNMLDERQKFLWMRDVITIVEEWQPVTIDDQKTWNSNE